MKTTYTLIVERMLEIRKEIDYIRMLLSLHDEKHIHLQLTELQKELELLKQKKKRYFGMKLTDIKKPLHWGFAFSTW